MSKVFYDHLVIREDVTVELDRFVLDPQEKSELIEIVDQTLHHHILNVIFNHLPKTKHPEFVAKLTASPHDPALLDYLKVHAHPEIESEISQHAAQLKRELLAEIKKSSHRK